MTREELLRELGSIAETELGFNTRISECNELDSLTLLNIFTFLRSHYKSLTIEDFILCTSVEQIIDKVLPVNGEGS